ncbi:MAG: hypothetical protein IPO15_01685 [Anaerolineae bacterium]|uniref:hypothetical protein n=1 Tax=Candidatus Amarolinea dominans TaxID=3140696 RepID=UPI003134E25D|nr:hypothetical protein [Anaerolineae bacterium]
MTENPAEKSVDANTDYRTDTTGLRDVRVAAIEFDSKKAVLNDGRLGLLVVIENRGDAPEYDVPVRVILSDDADSVVLDHTEYASVIAGRETAIIRFEGNLAGALRSRYQLRVPEGWSCGDLAAISKRVARCRRAARSVRAVCYLV